MSQYSKSQKKMVMKEKTYRIERVDVVLARAAGLRGLFLHAAANLELSRLVVGTCTMSATRIQQKKFTSNTAVLTI